MENNMVILSMGPFSDFEAVSLSPYNYYYS